MTDASGLDGGPTPAIAIQLARIQEVDLVAGLGVRRHAAILRLERPRLARWLPLSTAVLAAAGLVGVAFGLR